MRAIEEGLAGKADSTELRDTVTQLRAAVAARIERAECEQLLARKLDIRTFLSTQASAPDPLGTPARMPSPQPHLGLPAPVATPTFAPHQPAAAGRASPPSWDSRPQYADAPPPSHGHSYAHSWKPTGSNHYAGAAAPTQQPASQHPWSYGLAGQPPLTQQASTGGSMYTQPSASRAPAGSELAGAMASQTQHGPCSQSRYQPFCSPADSVAQGPPTTGQLGARFGHTYGVSTGNSALKQPGPSDYGTPGFAAYAAPVGSAQGHCSAYTTPELSLR